MSKNNSPTTTPNKSLQEKLESPKKHDKNKHSPEEEPKPRIVLTFRSEKAGLKSSTMKIVPNDEKVLSTDSHDEDASPTSKKPKSQPVSETDDTMDAMPKRSVRCRTKEYSDNVLANAIARKEKSYNEATPATSQRPSRRIKPTAKVLANKELNQSARLTDKSPEEGVQTRRSIRHKSVDPQPEESSKMAALPDSPRKRKLPNRNQAPEEIEEPVQEDSKMSKKKKHLGKLGLKAIEGKEEDESNEAMETTSEALVEIEKEKSVVNEEREEQELGTEDELSEADALELVYQTTDSSDVDFCIKDDGEKGSGKRRSTRSSQPEIKAIVEPPVVEEQTDAPRRSTRIKSNVWGDVRLNLSDEESDSIYTPSRPVRRKQTEDSYEKDDVSEPMEGDEGEEPACPDESAEIVATCTCEEVSNIYAAPESDDKDAMPFCGAIESVDGARVGCSHSAARLDDGTTAPLVRAGPRAPYILVCTLHAAQMRKHMCCTTCGLFCSQGTFSQCSEGHLFHLDCGLVPTARQPAGCPHCGHTDEWWPNVGQPVNRKVKRVHVKMMCANKRILMHEQREQCTPAYLGFSTLNPSVLDTSPVIPKDLLPSTPVDLKKLCLSAKGKQVDDKAAAERMLCEAIENFENADDIIPKIAVVDLNKGLDMANGGTFAHIAAKRGNLTALYLLQYSGASLDATDLSTRTPLMVAVLELLEKSQKKTPKSKSTNQKEPVGAKETNDEDTATEKDSNIVDVLPDKDSKAKDARLMKVIRYLVAAGCDVNYPGPEGMTALHMAAQLGGVEVAQLLLSNALTQVDPRDHGGWTPLVWAAENKHPHVVRLLLSEGADPSACDSEGNGVLHWCALGGDAACLTLLLADPHRKAIDAHNAHGDTPLHVAARQGHYSCVVVLLARGARTDIENGAGELPVEVCSGECQTAITTSMQVTLTIRAECAPYKMLTSDVSRGRERWPIPCVNEVDDALLPSDVTYVTRHITATRHDIDNTLTSMQGCTCTSTDCSSEACSCCALGVRRWSARGRLLPNFPYHDPPMLFECNETCGCDLRECTNTLVSSASRLGATFVRTQVFRCGGERGWGLRAGGPIAKGTPVANYVGELITVEEADTRSLDQYMFALEVKADLLEECADKSQLCVDAMRYGSAARFINHSCTPNLVPVRVFTNIRDLRLPVVTLFATKDIATFEELTFDYGDKFWSVKSKYMRCECGSPDCRYPTKKDNNE